MPDNLTGLPNRRDFDAHLARLEVEARAVGRPITVLMLDLDDFYDVNKAFGHPAGDELLVSVAKALADVVNRNPAVGFICRFGGEEFMSATNEPDFVAIRKAAEAMRAVVAAVTIEPRSANDAANEPYKKGVPITVSIGICSGPSSGHWTMAEIFRGADDALLEAKRLGKNQVCWRTLR